MNRFATKTRVPEVGASGDQCGEVIDHDHGGFQHGLSFPVVIMESVVTWESPRAVDNPAEELYDHWSTIMV